MDSYLLIGIKGSGMSSLAQILNDLGHKVQGEDNDSYIYTQDALIAKKIPIYPFGKSPLSTKMTVVVSNAFDDNHPAITRCKLNGLSIKRQHHFLGELIKKYTSIAVTGSHGKTSTTGLLSHTLSSVEPICSLIGDGSGNGNKNAKFFIFEGCEYKRHFLAYKPDIAIITNIDYDHPDYFKDMSDVRDAFEEMASSVNKHLIVCGDDPQVELIKTDKEMLRYGFKDTNDLKASHLHTEESGVSFNVYWRDEEVGNFFIPVHGKHNVLNALSVIGVSLVLGVNLADIKKQMMNFPGVKRRFTEKIWNDNILIDDYAHHPTEIKATIEAVKSKYPKKNLVVAFQPHTYSRVEAFLDDFANSLLEADEVFLFDIFGSAREQNGKVSIEQLSERIPNAKHMSEDNITDLFSYKDSVLLFMGAGDIQKYQKMLVKS